MGSKHFTVAIAICAYGKPLMLAEILKMATTSNLIDAIYVLDGPYSFNKDIYASCGFYSNATNSEIRNVCESCDKVHYQFGIFKDEASKRVQLYKMVKEDIVCLLDLDELPVSFDDSLFLAFYESDCAAGGIEMINIVNPCTKLGDKPIKNAIFKRAIVGPQDHLNFTWLVGIAQEAINPSVVFSRPLASVLHFYALRDRNSLLQKFIFYTTLWHHNHNNRVFLSISEYASAFGFTYTNELDGSLMLESVLATDRNYLGMVTSSDLIALNPEERKIVEQIIVARELSVYKQGRILLRNHNQPIYLTAHNLGGPSIVNEISLKLLLANPPATHNLGQALSFNILYEKIENGLVLEASCDSLETSIEACIADKFLVKLTGQLEDHEPIIVKAIVEVRYNGMNSSGSTISMIDQ